MKKHDIRFCKCGKIHLIPFDKINNAIENNKDLLFICADCGQASIIGADIDIEDGEKHYLMYGGDFSPYSSESITKNDFCENRGSKKELSEIYYSRGIKVPMMNGYYATEFSGGIFYDGRVIANMYEIDRPDITPEEVHQFIKKSREEAMTVNINRFIRENDDEALLEISRYYIKGFDWSGTKYALTHHV